MSNCIFDDENERIQEYYQMLLSPEWFQVTALEGEESTQQGTPGKHNFYKWVKKVNWVNRELKQIKRKCVKQSEGWHDTVPEGAVVQNSIFYKNHHFWISKSIITELLWLTYNEPLNDHQEQNWTKS